MVDKIIDHNQWLGNYFARFAEVSVFYGPVFCGKPVHPLTFGQFML